MNRNGSTTLFVIIITAVCLPILGFSWQTLFIQSKLNSNRLNMIQGQLNLETEINRIIYDQNGINDSIIKIIRKFPNECFKSESVYNIPISLNSNDNLSAELSFENKRDDRPKFKLNIRGNFNGNELNKTVIGSLLTRVVDDCDDGLVYLQNHSEDYINKLEELLTTIPDCLDINFLPSNHSLIRALNYNELRIEAKPYGPSKLYFNNSNCNYISIANNNMVLIIKSNGFDRNTVLIDATQASTVLRGIIYIENGDLIFKGKSEFQGIVLIKDGEIKREGEELSLIKGKVLMNSFKDPREAVEINYDCGNYLKYAKYLSSLMDPQIIKIERD